MTDSLRPSSMPPPPADSRKAAVAVGVSVACLTYAASLAVQRVLPALKVWLGLTLGDVRPTYYLRSLLSIALGIVLALVVPRGARAERWLALGAAIAIGMSVVVVALVP
jgi:hypothetical protein